MRFEIISDWNKARARISALRGKFKSSVFRNAFKLKPYSCDFLILSDGDRLLGAMTYWMEDKHCHLGDFDTAAGTHGAGNLLFERFLRDHREKIILWCWDENAESFWRYMGKKNLRPARKIGLTPFGTTKLQLKEAA